MILHKHHIVPKHAGGSDSPENIKTATIQEHAGCHFQVKSPIKKLLKKPEEMLIRHG